MDGETNLSTLLASMSPALAPEEYVFCTCGGSYGDFAELSPLASFREQEGLTLVLRKEAALSANLTFSAVFRLITLNVHSSLEAVGLTAAVSTALTQHAISANVIAAYYHDHILVPAEKSDLAVEVLRRLSCAPESDSFQKG